MITVKHLTFGYAPEAPILHDVCMELPRGRVLGILGPNGAGKSTLLRLLNRRLKPWEGQIELNGRALEDFKVDEIAQQIAVVPQNPAATFDFTVEELVAMGRRPHHGLTGSLGEHDREAADEAITATGLDPLRKRPITLLSGGETQLAFVARALAQQAQTLLLDEATASLDIKHATDILSIIRKRVNAEGLTVAAVVHDINVAVSFCDDIIFLQEGQTVGPGTPEELVDHDTLQNVYGVQPERVSIYKEPLHVRARIDEAPRE